MASEGQIGVALTQSTTAITDPSTVGTSHYDPKLVEILFDYDMERISKGELQDEIDYLKARAIREGRANE